MNTSFGIPVQVAEEDVFLLQRPEPTGAAPEPALRKLVGTASEGRKGLTYSNHNIFSARPCHLNMTGFSANAFYSVEKEP